LKTEEVGVPIRPGDWFLIESAGGGYGPPSKRDPAARAADVACFPEEEDAGEAARPSRLTEKPAEILTNGCQRGCRAQEFRQRAHVDRHSTQRRPTGQSSAGD
jgi:hypothetical protein